MNYDQYREVLKKSKPLYAKPTVFGISSRVHVVVAVAVFVMIVLL